MEEYKLRQRQTTLSDFGHTLLESENAEPDFNELSVELKQDSEDYVTSPVSSTVHFFTSQSNEKTEIASTSPSKYEGALPKKPSESEEYIQRHVEEVSDRFYRTLFGESYVSSELCKKSVIVETYENEISSVDGGNCNIIPVCVQESSDVSKETDVNWFGISELSTKGAQSLTQIISSPLQQSSMSAVLVSGTDITEKITPTTLNQMSLDSVTEQPHILPLLITDSGSSEARVEIAVPVTLTRPTDAECTKTECTTSLSANAVECRPLTPVSLTSQDELRSLSPDIEFEYFDNFGMTSSEYRSSPESMDSLPLDSPVPFEYRPSSPDSCILMAELRVSSPESVTSENDCTFLSVDSPLPDFRPGTPLPTFENETPEFTIYIEEYKTLHAPGEQTDPLTGYAEDSLGAYCLELTDDTERPISPGSVLFCRSLSPESNRSWSPMSINSDILDSEHPTEKSFESYTPSPYAFLTELRLSSPESTASVNEYRVLPPDSPIPCFAIELQSDSSALMTGYRSPSLNSEISDVDSDLISLQCLAGSRPSSPESTVSINSQRCLSPDSPLPSFTQTVLEIFIPTKLYKSHSFESDLSDNENEPISEVLPETRISSPESFTSINEYRPLSPDSPLPVYRTTFHFNVIQFGSQRDSSPELETSDTEYSLCEPLICEPRPQSPESVILDPEYAPLSTAIVESVTSEGEPIEMLATEPAKSLYNEEQHLSELLKSKDTFMSKSMLSNRIAKIFDPHYKGVSMLVSGDVSTTLQSPQEIYSPRTESHIHYSFEQNIPVAIATHTVIMPLTGSRPSSPESVTLDVEDELCPPDLFPDQRSDSPQSIISEIEIRPLSPDSPVPQFMTLFPQSTLPVTGLRSCSPQSLCSEDTECEPCLEDLLNIEYRPDSPDSVLSDTDKRPLSPDSLPEWRPMSPDSAMLLKEIRGDSPQSNGSINECRPLSSDSPTPQYFPAVFESVSVTDYRSSSPESALSDKDFELSIFTLDSSLESTESISDERPDFRSLSPDSPIIQYCTFQFEPTMVTSHISPSPESVLSDTDVQDDLFDDMMIDLRRSSSESITSLNKNRPLSPDSPIPEFTIALHTVIMSLTGSRPSSPESITLDVENELCQSDLNPEQRSDSPQSTVSEIEIRPLSPDSPVPQFMTLLPQSTLPITGIRSCSPQSLCSEDTECEPYLEDFLNIEYRPDSPDSVLSDTDKRPLSPDSLPEWRPMSPDSAMLLKEIRGDSPQSNGSINECRPLSSDSPTPQYFPAVFESVSVTDYRSSSPESALSDEDFELNIFTLDSSPESTESINDERPDFRCLSPDSPVSQYYTFHFVPTILTGYTSLSPESVLSEIDMQTDIFDGLVTDLRRSSWESIASIDENRALSPDSPFPDFTPSTQSFIMPDIGSCPTSPELDCVDDENTLCQTDLNSEQRPDSPQSVISETGDIPLSSDSPVPQFSVFFSQITLPVLGRGSCSPQSLCSGTTEYEPSFENMFIRGSSPQSIESMNECRSPDSPVPHYSELFIEPRPIKGHGSSSPESMTSDVGYELEVSASKCQYGFPSVDSVSENESTSGEIKSHLAYFRASSPDSDTLVNDFKLLSPDSPVPQYFPAVFESVPYNRSLSDYISPSPESELSEEELNVLTTDASPESIIEGRSLSPDSPIPMPDSPIPQYYSSHFEPTMVTGYRSTSTQTILSEIEMQADVFDDSLMDLRTSSPESTTLATENGPLSPDSPVPDFTPSTYTFFIPESDSLSTSSVSLGDENELYPSDLSIGQRPDSPESVISEIEPRPVSPDSVSDYRPVPPHTAMPVVDASPEFFTSLEECRTLPPDFLQQFSYIHKMSEINVCRSESSESPSSETDIELWVIASQATEQRPSSPESIMSLNENRPLSPDSPIYDFKSSVFVNVTPKAIYRSSSLESVSSDVEFDMASFASEEVTWTENRPLSPASREISPVDPCHLEVEHNHTDEQSPQSLGQELASNVRYLPLHKTFTMVPEYKLVYKAVPLALISNLYDPQYRGETFCPKPGVFEYAGCKKETFKTISKIKANNEWTEQHNYDISNNDISYSETSSPFDTSSLESHVQPEQAFSTDSLFYYTSLNACLMDSSDRRASSPESYTSINEYRQLSPESPIPNHRTLLSWAESLVESRPSSPETIFSVNEFRSLSPDSPIPEYLTPSPVPNEHTSKSSEVLMQQKSILSPLSPSVCNDESSDIGSVCPESYSSWYPLPQWIMSENRPLSSVSDFSDTDSRSLSPQMFCFETELRNPSPEAATSDIELTETIIPESSVFETYYQPESPESVIIESEDEFYENLNDLSFSDIDESTNDLPVLKNDSASLNLVTFEPCMEQIEFPCEIEELQSVSEIRIECSFDDGLKPNASRDIASEQKQKDTESVTKTITYCEEQDITTATSASANEETSKGLKIHETDEKRHMESPQQQKEDLGHDLRKLAPQDDKERDNASEDIHLVPHVKDLSLEPQLKLTASLLTSEALREPYLATCVSNIPEHNRSQPTFDLKAHKSTPSSSPEEPKASNVLQEVNSFQFYLKDSHRRVELNQIDSSAFRLGLESRDYKNLPSRSVKTPSTGTQVSLADLSPISPMFNTSSSNQGNSPESHATGTVQFSPDFKCVVSKFEQKSPSLGGDKPKLSLAFPGTYPLVAAMTPCTLEEAKDLKASEMPTELTGDQMQLDATAVLDIESPLYSLNLKARPRPVHADSIESEAEFFDCRQTFSDTSDPDVGSSEVLDVPQTIYHVEELPSLSSSPEYLTGISKIREDAQLEKDERPLSWASEDLPIILEPEDEYTGEVGEEKTFPYDYTGDHSIAEELTPIEEAQYDDDDDSLGREIAEELGLLSDSSEEEVLTTRVVRRRVVIQGDEMPEIPPQTVTEEKYTDEYGNMVVKKITRKVIRKYVSADGVEREEVMLEGPQQEAVTVDEADGFSKVVKRTVVRSGGEQTEVTFSEPLSYIGATSSEFEEEPVQGRKVSKVIKTMVVQGERMEKLIGDPSLSSDLPSAKDDFEKALSYVGSFGKVHLPHLVEREMVKEDGSVVRRTRMHKTRTQKSTVVKDGQAKQTHLERLEDTPDSLRPDDLQQHLHQLLQRYCTPEVTEEPNVEQDSDAGEQDKQ
ncbi:ankyrin-2b isoform X32 [Labeo rohita]|uniref:ankyrin-2b isoform X32 n=1 Tax=Labeo rohita TaxID=84645 RepID=UPI0021E1E181|nr:ankyrin-2b isoform X32 [Labeo rohita]